MFGCSLVDAMLVVSSRLSHRTVIGLLSLGSKFLKVAGNFIQFAVSLKILKIENFIAKIKFCVSEQDRNLHVIQY